MVLGVLISVGVLFYLHGSSVGFLPVDTHYGYSPNTCGDISTLYDMISPGERALPGSGKKARTGQFSRGLIALYDTYASWSWRISDWLEEMNLLEPTVKKKKKLAGERILG